MTTEAQASPDPLVPEDEDEWLRESLAPKRRWPKLTMALAATTVAAVAFMAGVLIEKNYFVGSSGGGGVVAAALRTRAGAAFGGASTNGRAGLPGGGATIGQVKVIKGNTIYVTDTSGNTVKVALTASTRLTAQKQAKIKDLHPGDTVTVRGGAGASGTIQATTVAIGTAGGGFGSPSFGSDGSGNNPTGFGG